MVTQIVSIVALGVSITMMIIAFVTLSHNTKKDDKNESKAEEQAMYSIKESLLKANMKLDQVCMTTTETRSDIKAANNKINEIDKELQSVKTEVKTAFMRIDELRDMINEVKHE